MGGRQADDADPPTPYCIHALSSTKPAKVEAQSGPLGVNIVVSGPRFVIVEVVTGREL